MGEAISTVLNDLVTCITACITDTDSSVKRLGNFVMLELPGHVLSSIKSHVCHGGYV